MLNWMVTGANGNLGRRLVRTLLSDHTVTAVVRSNKAAEAVQQIDLSDDERSKLDIKVVDYTDVRALHEVALNCSRAVHLVGILKETPQATYRAAHEVSCKALVEATTNTPISHITYLSIVGSHPDAKNACLASKGRAEQLLIDRAGATTVLRVPMVLGEGDYASFALKKRAAKGLSFTFRALSMEQPVYAGDVVSAVIKAGQLELDAALDLGGPEALSRRALTQRAAQSLGGKTRVISLPIALGYALAGLLETMSANPPFTRAMLGVLDHDDVVASDAGWQSLGQTQITTLDDMLEKVLK